MTQYLMAVCTVEGEPMYANETEEQASGKDVDAFNEELQASGAWVFAGGLHGPDTATTVDATGVEVVTTDGPFAESKEQIAGFWVVEAPDLDAALALAAKGSAACRAKIEVRPFHDQPAD
jgi:hypothetical protein